MSALGQKQTFALQYSVSAGRSWLTINPNRWMSALFLRPRLWHRRRKPVRSCYLLRQTVVDVWSDFFFKRGSQHSVFASTTWNSFRRQIALQGNFRELRRIRAEGQTCKVIKSLLRLTVLVCKSSQTDANNRISLVIL